MASKTAKAVLEMAKRGERNRKRNRRKACGLPYKAPLLEIDPTITDRFCDIIRSGNHISVALRVLKMSRPLYRRWMNLGKEGISPYDHFYREVIQAEAECEALLVEQWVNQGEGDWRAIQNFLARRFPDRWKDTKETKTDINVSGQVQIVLPDNGREAQRALPAGQPASDVLEVEGEFEEVDEAVEV